MNCFTIKFDSLSMVNGFLVFLRMNILKLYFNFILTFLTHPSKTFFVKKKTFFHKTKQKKEKKKKEFLFKSIFQKFIITINITWMLQLFKLNFKCCLLKTFVQLFCLTKPQGKSKFWHSLIIDYFYHWLLMLAFFFFKLLNRKWSS